MSTRKRSSKRSSKPRHAKKRHAKRQSRRTRPKKRTTRRKPTRGGYKKTKAFRDKVHRVMHEFKYGRLHSGSKRGPIVKNRRQAIAIALSEARRR